MKTNKIYTSMKRITLMATVLLAVSCGVPNNDFIKKQIENKRATISKLEKEISELQKQLTDTAETITEIAVNVKQMNSEEFKHYITVFGNVEADKYAVISPEMNGQITKIYVTEGQRVSEGTLLVSLNTDATQSSINEAKTNLELATTTFEKQKNLWEQNIGSEIQYLQAKTQKEAAEARVKMLQAQLRMSQIRAPFDGIVDKIYPKEGESAGPATPVIEFVNLSRLTIKADISETYIEEVHPGETVELSFPTLPELDLKTKISRTSKVINAKSRTFQIELNINNPREQIRPNMISAIRINDYTAKDAFVVPSIVIKRDITGDYLYVASTNEKNKLMATKKYVKRGMTYEGYTEIIEGIKKSDKVIIAGYNLVSSGSYVAIN